MAGAKEAPILITGQPGLVVISLNRPRVLNTLNQEMIRRLRRGLEEALAAHFMITHPDYLEGIRARIIDKDDQPRWQPGSLEAVGALATGF